MVRGWNRILDRPCSAVISSFFTYIYAKFIDEWLHCEIREKAIADMEAKGQSEEQIEMAMKFVDMFTKAEAILFIGLIFWSFN